MNDNEISEDELDISTEQNDEGMWIARVFHKPSSTIKISDYFLVEEEAKAQAIGELRELVTERMKGLGK